MRLKNLFSLVMQYLIVLIDFFDYFFIFFTYKHFRSKKIKSNLTEENIEGKVVVITGGSSGLGKASAKEFAKRGAVVVIGDVDLQNGQLTVEEIKNETGNTNVKILKLDLSDMGSVEEFAKHVSLEHRKIKILLNNAGIGDSSKIAVGTKTKDGLNMHVSVNYMGHFLLTNLLKKNLKSETKARVVSVSSSLQLLSKLDLEDLNMEKSGFGFRNSLPYANTKFCNALFMKELGKRVSGTEIRTYALCPGQVNTAIFDNIPNHSLSRIYFDVMKPLVGISVNDAASDFVMHCALDKSIENETGKMYRGGKHFDAANNRLDDKLACQLWEKSSQIVKLQERLTRMK